jgi:hypothetical protein
MNPRRLPGRPRRQGHTVRTNSAEDVPQAVPDDPPPRARRRGAHLWILALALAGGGWVRVRQGSLRCASASSSSFQSMPSSSSARPTGMLAISPGERTRSRRVETVVLVLGPLNSSGAPWLCGVGLDGAVVLEVTLRSYSPSASEMPSIVLVSAMPGRISLVPNRVRNPSAAVPHRARLGRGLGRRRAAAGLGCRPRRRARAARVAARCSPPHRVPAAPIV